MDTFLLIAGGVVGLVLFWKISLWLVRHGASGSGLWGGGCGGSM
ncbi:MAG: hypothetical protein ACI89L_001787 [Phycisphaerales bacterium]|jgi:hypothetical protein